MTDSLKFGPEWLRNLSQDGCAQSSISTPRYQLAEHRYGREEMLALFDRLVKAPDTLVGVPALYVEKTQTPLALLQMTEEETRTWNRGINSDAVLRIALKTPASGIPGGNRGGRGGSVDRGRGRGRGGYHYTRGLSYEEPGEAGDMRSGRGGPDRGESSGSSAAVSFPRSIRSFDRTQSSTAERSWGERNGVDPGDWNGSTSPRKDFSGRGFMAENWRRHRGGGEDDEGWRTASSNRTEKWGRPNSWRDGEKEGADDRGGRSWDRNRGWNENAPTTHTAHRRPWDEDHLPEWAMENPSESGGSFDASGAFHGGGGFSDDEDGGPMGRGHREPRTRLLSEGNSSKKGQSQPSRRVGGLSHDAGPPGQDDHPRREEGPGVEQIDSAHQHQQHQHHSTHQQISNENVSGPSFKNLPSSESDKNKTVNVSMQPSSKSESSDKVNSVPTQPPVNAENMSETTSSVKTTGNGKHSATNNAGAQQTRKPSPDVTLIVPDNTATCVSDNVDHRFPSTQEPVNNMQLHQPSSKPVGRQKSEDDMERMQEVADDLVAKLIYDEEGQDKTTSRIPSMGTSSVRQASDKWFYRDPQGEVQGPFSAAEMAEWFRSGYFTLSLLVRRGCDECYSQLGDLIKKWGRVPFLPGPTMPPLKIREGIVSRPQGSGVAHGTLQTPMSLNWGSLPTTDPVATTTPTLVQPTPSQGIPGGLPQDSLLLHQYQYMLQRQLQLRQAATVQAVVGKLSQSEQWNTLTPLEQQQLIMQQMAQQPMDASLGPFATQKNPVFQLLSQMQQQAKVPPPPPLVPESSKIPSGPVPNPPLDPLQQLIRDMGGLQQPVAPSAPLGMGPVPNAATPMNMPNMMHAAPPPPPTDKVDDPIQSLLRQLGGKVVKPQVDSVWGGTIAPTFNAQSWLQQMAPVPAAPPGQLPTSLWDLHGKDMKTEQQILEEQMRAEEERRREEQRKQEEAEKQRKQLEEELQKREAEKKRLEEQMARMEEEHKRQEEERKKRQAEEERKKKEAEEERKRQEERKKKEAEEERRRQEEAKRREEEQRKKEEAARKREEEKKRKEEEKERKRKLEEERKREEEERKRQEEEAARKKAEEEEQTRRQEQQRRQAEALRRLQERQQQQRAKAAPWSQQASVQPSVGGSLVEIQRQEKEKKEKEAREREQQQALLLLQQQQQQQLQQQQTAAEAARGGSLQLKWAEKKPAPASKVKSLSEIQAEEQEQLAKQVERERVERAQQQKETPLPTSVNIWGTATQSLTWASAATANTNSTSVWGGASTGNSTYWEEVSPPAVQKPTVKNAPKAKVPTPVAPVGKGSNKTRSKKDEALVMKLFEQKSQRGDEFDQWCTKALDNLQATVDIPTFVGFLRDIESPYDVKDYVKLYLGDEKEAQEFARQFLERRSKLRSAQRAVPQEDDMCVPAPAVNPLSTDFQEVKGKGKKAKKSKMFKVDNRILGFNVTAAQDRINVGDRDYGEGM
ncbi:hypothetical protein R5R35_003385 [Gryllus longicercus]|uniref:GYF domain-containing protein n=1 Tax=Gryllus longicercus TaxID=2509291 RepID=A0AAN9ZCI3_9ORTH